MSFHRPSIVNAPHALKSVASSYLQTSITSGAVVFMFGVTADSTHIYALPKAPAPLNNNAFTVPPEEPLYVYVVNEGGTIRYTTDGTTPSATVGFPLVSYQSILMSLQDAKKFQAIAVSTSATLNSIRYDE